MPGVRGGPEFFGLATPVTVDPQFGTANTSINIVIPPGRKAMTPSVAIRYTSSGQNGPFGIGWDFSMGSVKRNSRHGVPIDRTTLAYDDASGFVLTFPRGTVILDRCLDAVDPSLCNRWASQVEESWVDAQFDRGANVWRVKDKSGLQYTFGGAPAARTGFNVNDDAGTSGWSLTSTVDPNTNRINVVYLGTVPPSGENRYAYVSQIDYGGNASAGYSDIFHVGVFYEAAARPDLPISYKGGFAEQITKRVETVKVWVDPISTSTTPSRTYQFTYQQDADTDVSQLRTVRLIVPGETSPPDTTFTYQPKPNGLNGAAYAIFDHQPSTQARAALQSVELGPARVKSGFIDVNGDHLPDFLDGYSGSGSAGDGHAGLELYLNRGGNRFEWQGLWTTLTSRLSWDATGAAGFSRLLDMTGDGLPDLVTNGNCTGSGSPTTTCNWNVFPNSAGLLQASPMPTWSGVPTTLLGRFPNPIQPSGGSARQAQLVDLNGDGLPDLLHCSAWTAASPFCDFHQNNGTGFSAAESWRVPDIPEQWFSDPGNPLDAFPTLQWGLLAAKVGGGTQSHGGDDLGTCTISYIQTYELLKTLVDINGDGLPDIVSNGEPERNCWPCGSACCGLASCGPNARWTYTNAFSAEPWQVAFNTGAGFEDPVAWEGTQRSEDPIYQDFTTGQGAEGTERVLYDLNGDVLPDYIIFFGDNQDWQVALNGGDGFMGDPTTRTAWSGIGNNIAVVQKSDGISIPDGKVRAAPLDIDGDGIADRLQTISPVTNPDGPNTFAFFEVRPGRPPRAGLLQGVDNGMGGSWEVTYQASAQADAQLPFPVWVVQSLTGRSGLTGTGHTLTTDYEFSGAYFDVGAREFRGFQESTETRTGDGRTVQRIFAAPFAPGSTVLPLALAPFKLVREEVRDATARLLTQTTSDWGSVTVTNPVLDRQRVRPLSATKTVFGNSEGAWTKQIRTFDGYDAYNNVTSVTVSGAVARTAAPTTPTPTTLSSTTVSYAYDVPDSILDRPSTVEVKTTSGSTTTTWSSREYQYDGKGNLSEVRDWLDRDNLNAGGTRTVSTMKLLYDSAVDDAARTGLPTRVTLAWGDGGGAEYNIRYTCSQGLYPCTVTNPLLHVTSRTYDLVSGRALSVTDPNNAVITYDYDGFGRLKSVTAPLDPVDAGNPTGAQREAATINYVPGSASPARPGRIETNIREPSNATGYRSEVEFFDGLGRSLERKSESNVGGVAEQSVHDALLFDAVGRVRKRLVPFAGAEDETSYDAPNDSQAATSFTYDGLDRVIVRANPDGNSEETGYDIGGGIETRDENYVACAPNPSAPNASCPGRKTAELYDPFGRLVEATMYRGASTIRTTVNQYDPLHRVLSTTTKDAAGNSGNSQITYTYDSLGRRLTMTENDSGLWRYVYDDAGNVVSQDDPRPSQHVEMCYDELNRPTMESSYVTDAFSGASCNGSGDQARYYYDGAIKGKGRLWEAHGPLTTILSTTPVEASVTRIFEYDERGREVQTRKSLAVTSGPARSFTWRFVYDVADRVTKMNYPTNATDEELWYAYDSVGRPRSTYTLGNPYAQQAVYDRFGRLTGGLYATGPVREDRVYSTAATDNYRLQRSVTSTSSGTVLQDFTYGPYDRAGNLLQVNDVTPASQYPAGSARDNDWTYTYYGEGRLNTSRKGASGPTATFTYDYLDNLLIGNLGFPDLSPNLIMFTDGSRPHRMAALFPPGLVPTYHNDGGLKSRPATLSGDLGKTQVDYDVDGRVSRVVMSDGSVVEYAYDHTGQVMARVVNDSEVTLYFDDLFEVRSSGNELVRHIYFGGRRIAFSPTTAPPELTLAALPAGERNVMLARVETSAGGDSSGARGSDARATLTGVAAAGFLGLLGLAFWGPARVRLSFFGRVRRGWVVGLAGVLSGSVLLPSSTLHWLDLTTPAAEACPLPPPVFPVYLVSHDHLGSATMLTTSKVSGVADGTPVEYYRYGPYGKVQAYSSSGGTVAAGSERTDVLFTGQRWDSRTQLYRFPARFYDPQIARFVSLDPAGVGTNPYGYVRWNPVNRIDPTGLADLGYECAPSAGFSFCGVVVSGGNYGGPFDIWTDALFGDSGLPRPRDPIAQSIDLGLQSFHSTLEERAGFDAAEGNYLAYGVDILVLEVIPPDLRSLQFALALGVVTSGAGNVARPLLGRIARFIPNPGGRLGDAVTRATTQRLSAQLETQGLRVAREVRFEFKTPGGLKGRRFADVVGVNPETGARQVFQIGLLTKSGLPVKRERRAIVDILKSPEFKAADELYFIDKFTGRGP